MNISSFSKRCVISNPDYEVFDIMPSEFKTNGERIVRNVLGRLIKLGVTDFSFLANTSLNLEASRFIAEQQGQGYPVKYEAYASVPHSFKKLWLDHFAINDRLDLVFNPTQELLLSSLETIELKISNVLNEKGEGSSVSALKEENSKFTFTRDIFLLTAMNRPVTEKDMKITRQTYEEALYLIGVSKEQFEQSIKENLDVNYQEATRLFLNETQKNINSKSLQEETEETEQARGSIFGAIQKMKSAQNKQSEGSKFSFDFNAESFQGSEELEKELRDSNEVTLSINEAFSDELGIKESYSKGMHIEAFNKIEKLCDEYEITVLKSLCEDNPIMVNFYLQTTDPKFKALDNYGGNRFCLNVDLKTGSTDLTLKGQTFKMNALFLEGEPVLVNANEWGDY